MPRYFRTSLSLLAALFLGAGALGIGSTVLFFNKELTSVKSKIEKYEKILEDIAKSKNDKNSVVTLEDDFLSIENSTYKFGAIATYNSNKLKEEILYYTTTVALESITKDPIPILMTVSHVVQPDTLNKGGIEYKKTEEIFFIGSSQSDFIPVVPFFINRDIDLTLFKLEMPEKIQLHTLNTKYKFGNSKNLKFLDKLFAIGYLYDNYEKIADSCIVTQPNPNKGILKAKHYTFDTNTLFILKTGMSAGFSGTFLFSFDYPPTINGMLVATSESELRNFAVKINPIKEAIKPYISEKYYQ